MKKAMFLILALSVALSLCACTSKETEQQATLPPESLIWGTWEANYFGSTAVYVFNEDGTYTNYIQSSYLAGTNGTYEYDASTSTLILYKEDETESKLSAKVAESKLILRNITSNPSMDLILSKVD